MQIGGGWILIYLWWYFLWRSKMSYCKYLTFFHFEWIAALLDIFSASRPQVLAEMCHSGYKDALRFLEENSESSIPWLLWSFSNLHTFISASSLTFGLCYLCGVFWLQTCLHWSVPLLALPCQRARSAAATILKQPRSGCSEGSDYFVNSTVGWMNTLVCLLQSRKVRYHPRISTDWIILL